MSDNLLSFIIGMFFSILLIVIGLVIGESTYENKVYNVLINNPEMKSIEILQELEKVENEA